MSELQKDIKKNAIAWLERFSQELECDPDIINLMPIDEIRESLRASGADVEGFHVKITEMLLRSKAENLLPKLKTWLSLPWKPQWAGEVVTAADIGPQEETFKMDYGQYINISCYWQGEDSSSSAFIHLKWNANILFSSNLWAWFVDPDTHETLFKDCLGSDLEGKKIFMNRSLASTHALVNGPYLFLWRNCDVSFCIPECKSARTTPFYRMRKIQSDGSKTRGL